MNQEDTLENYPLDVALRNSRWMREECAAAQRVTIDRMQRTIFPNHSSAVAARGLVVGVSRAAARLRSSTESLEAEARVVRTAHRAELEAIALKTKVDIGDLEAARQRSEAALRAELAECKDKLEKQSMAVQSLQAKQMDGDLSLAEARSIEAHMAELSADLAAERELTKRYRHRIASLEKDIPRLEIERDAVVSKMKHEAEELRHTIANLQEELVRRVTSRNEFEEQVQSERDKFKSLECELRQEIRDIDQLRVHEMDRLQGEIDHMHALQKEALRVGTYKGRQMHYFDSLRAKPLRAKGQRNELAVLDEILLQGRMEAAAVPIRAAASWRSEEETKAMTEAMLSE